MRTAPIQEPRRPRKNCQKNFWPNKWFFTKISICSKIWYQKQILCLISMAKMDRPTFYTSLKVNSTWYVSKKFEFTPPVIWRSIPYKKHTPRFHVGALSKISIFSGGGARSNLPKFKFLVEFPIGLQVILQLQIKKNSILNKNPSEVQPCTPLEIMLSGFCL